MPDQSGKLSPDELAKLTDWWKQHWKGEVVCPVCKSKDWAASNRIVQNPAGTMPFGGLSLPSVVVLCRVCGYTMLFNAVKIGIVTASPSEPEPEAATPPPAKTG